MSQPFSMALKWIRKINLRFKLLIFDILTLACLVLPLVDYLYVAGPQVRTLKLANQALKETTVSLTSLNRYERDMDQIINRVERNPNAGYLYSFDALSERMQSVLSDLEGYLQKESVLKTLGANYLRSETSRLSITRSLAVGYLQDEPIEDILAIRRKLATAEELHLAMASDLTSYLANVSAEYSMRADAIETRLIYSWLFYLLVAIFLISFRHWYLRRRVLKPIELVYQGQKKIESGLFPGPIQAKRLEPEIQALINSFNGMERGIRDFYEYTSILTSATVHDLKEPFAAILSLRNLIGQGLSAESFGVSSEEIWNRVGLNCRVGIDLIDNLLQYTRSSMGKLEYNELNPLPQIKQIFEQTQQQFFDLEAVLKVGVLHSIWCDSSQMQTVLRNIIVNAFKYADKSKEQLEIEFWTDESTSKEGIRYIRLHARDNGIGYEMEALEILSNPFEQLDPRNEKHQEFIKGVGLGLSICHRIVHGHHGMFEVRSRPGQGTEFILLFPERPQVQRRMSRELPTAPQPSADV